MTWGTWGRQSSTIKQSCKAILGVMIFCRPQYCIAKDDIWSVSFAPHLSRNRFSLYFSVSVPSDVARSRIMWRTTQLEEADQDGQLAEQTCLHSLLQYYCIRKQICGGMRWVQLRRKQRVPQRTTPGEPQRSGLSAECLERTRTASPSCRCEALVRMVTASPISLSPPR